VVAAPVTHTYTKPSLSQECRLPVKYLITLCGTTTHNQHVYAMCDTKWECVCERVALLAAWLRRCVWVCNGVCVCGWEGTWQLPSADVECATHEWHLYTSLQVLMCLCHGLYVIYTVYECVCGCLWPLLSLLCYLFAPQMAPCLSNSWALPEFLINFFATFCIWNGRNPGVGENLLVLF